MKRMIPLILMLAMLFTGCASGTIQNGESLSIEPKPETVKSTLDPWRSIDEQVENAPQVELTRVTATDTLPAACIFAEEAPETVHERLPVEPGFEPAVTAIAGQAEADPPVKVVEDMVTQGQETIAAAAPQAAPAVLKSSVSWNPAPRQKTATPIPKISVDFVITCPPEPTPTPEMPEPTETPAAQPSTEPVAPEVPQTPAPEQPAAPEPAPDPAPTLTPEPEATPKPSGGYAVCSCGATLMPDELVAHMKAHALKGESHSYVAH